MADDWATVMPELGLASVVLFGVWAIWRTVRGQRGRALNWAIAAWLLCLIAIAARGVVRMHVDLSRWQHESAIYAAAWGALIVCEVIVIVVTKREDRARTDAGLRP